MVSSEKSEVPLEFPLGLMIRGLMEHFKMSEADLCRGVGLPQTTINRLLTGQTSDPRISTLMVLAQFFNITLDQLTGKEKLILSPSYNQAKGSTIPVIAWKDLQIWLTHPNGCDCNSIRFLKTEKTLSKGSFAVRTPVACEPVFGKDSILIMERLHDPEPLEGQMVLVEISAGQYGLRQVLQEGNTYYLKRLFPPFDVIPAHKNAFHACVVEARIDRFIA